MTRSGGTREELGAPHSAAGGRIKLLMEVSNTEREVIELQRKKINNLKTDYHSVSKTLE